MTDRDIVWMIAEGLDPKEAEVGQFMQAELQTVCVNDSLSDVTHKMREGGVRRLPIVDTERRLIGLVSLDDVLVLLGREMSDAAATISGEIEHERHIGDAIRKGEALKARDVISLADLVGETIGVFPDCEGGAAPIP